MTVYCTIFGNIGTCYIKSFFCSNCDDYENAILARENNRIKCTSWRYVCKAKHTSSIIPTDRKRTGWYSLNNQPLSSTAGLSTSESASCLITENNNTISVARNHNILLLVEQANVSKNNNITDNDNPVLLCSGDGARKMELVELKNRRLK